MAASGMSARSVIKLARLSRSLLFSRPQGRPCAYQMCTAATGNKTVTDKPPSPAETVKASAEKTGAPEDTKATAGAGAGTEVKKEAKPADGPSEVEKRLTDENKKLQEELKEIKDKYMRALAETENVRQRLMKQVADAKVFGIQGFCKDLLEIADVLNQATGSVPKEEMEKNLHLKALFDGLTMTDTQLHKVFGKHGLQKIDPAIGEKFDPFFHEALFQVPIQGDCQPDTVANVQKTGYKLHDRTLRPALVGVFKS